MAIEPSVVTDSEKETLLWQKFSIRNITEILVLEGRFSKCRKKSHLFYYQQVQANYYKEYYCLKSN